MKSIKKIYGQKINIVLNQRVLKIKINNSKKVRILTNKPAYKRGDKPSEIKVTSFFV